MTITNAASAVRPSMPQRVSAYIAVALSGLFAGFLLTVSVLEFTLRSADAETYTKVRHIELAHLDTLATVLLIPALLALVTLVITSFRRDTVYRWPAVMALSLLLTTLVISVTVSVPINMLQLGWSVSSPPADWVTVRDRWQLAHLVRTTTSLLAFLTLLAAKRHPKPRRDTPHEYCCPPAVREPHPHG